MTRALILGFSGKAIQILTISIDLGAKCSVFSCVLARIWDRNNTHFYQSPRIRLKE